MKSGLLDTADTADTANLVECLLSPQGAKINGQLLYSNGGFPKGRLPA